MKTSTRENNSFVAFDNRNSGVIFDDSKHETYPIVYYNVINGKGFEAKEGSSYFGFVYEGDAILHTKDAGILHLKDGMYFSESGQFSFNEHIHGKIVIIEVIEGKGFYPENNYRAMFTIGGPIEEKGRLKYIDGCTDSLLIPPVKKGDPCLNHLHFPKGIDQTQHTHPSHRIGIVARGNGECITPFGVLPLTKGMIFVIKEWDGETWSEGLDGQKHPHGKHAFRTEDETMDVVAFHPDSDFGATDEVHPMINRTIVDGKSASEMDEIRTK